MVRRTFPHKFSDSDPTLATSGAVVYAWEGTKYGADFRGAAVPATERHGPFVAPENLICSGRFPATSTTEQHRPGRAPARLPAGSGARAAERGAVAARAVHEARARVDATQPSPHGSWKVRACLALAWAALLLALLLATLMGAPRRCSAPPLGGVRIRSRQRRWQPKSKLTRSLRWCLARSPLAQAEWASTYAATHVPQKVAEKAKASWMVNVRQLGSRDGAGWLPGGKGGRRPGPYVPPAQGPSPGSKVAPGAE